MSRAEMAARGWDAPDILLISGDAYVDHPSFGVALLGRLLEAGGFRVCVAAQPVWEGEAALEALRALGRPRLFAGVSAGALDSMLAHYTAFRKKRHDDAYSPGGRAGLRPNRACIVYTGLVRRAFPGLPVLLGGIEASLRRFSHYDFWSNSLRRSILLDSKADLLLWGMAERSLLAVARIAAVMARETGAPLERGVFAAACRTVPGLAYAIPRREAEALFNIQAPEPAPDSASMPDSASIPAAKTKAPPEANAFLTPAPEPAPDSASAPDSERHSVPPAFLLPAHEDILAEPRLLMRATLEAESLTHRGGRHLLQAAGDRMLALTPPPLPSTQAEMDAYYSLPFTRLPHPAYALPIPAWETVRASITSHRGCGGGCSFCSLALHQGRRIASRSRRSILAEAARIAAGPEGGKAPAWAGAITDVSGPSANMWQARCALPPDKQCARPSCLHPARCPLFEVDQERGARLLRAVAALDGVRHVRLAGGLRFDLALEDDRAMKAYALEFTGGQLKVAPEHSEDQVLKLMRKPHLPLFERFLAAFARLSDAAGKEQYTVPYLMSAFPGCTEEHMRKLAAWLKARGWRPRQVQCFVPTPGTVATAMFYTQLSPKGEKIYVALSDRERLEQHHLLLGRSEGAGGSKGRQRARRKDGSAASGSGKSARAGSESGKSAKPGSGAGGSKKTRAGRNKKKPPV